MFIPDPRYTLVFAHEHARRLQEDTAADRLRRSPAVRHALAASLRRLANRLDRTPLTTATA